MESEALLFAAKLVALLMLAAFLPLTGISFFYFRRHQRRAELERIFTKLNIDHNYKRIHTTNITGWHFTLSVSFATMISMLGLAVLLLGRDLGFASSPSIMLGGARVISAPGEFGVAIEPALVQYQRGGLLVFGMAFLGAYLWGLQMIVRRYTLNDLVPAAYYHLGVRMISAAVVALLVYHTADGGQGAEGVIFGQHLLPAVAFMVGMFPQRGMHWIKQRLHFLLPKENSTVRELPLEMIEGMSRYDRMRLEELGIESCHDLAASDFIPLLLRTPYGARELIEWLLQAKLCVQFGERVKPLRAEGIRLITDLEKLQEADLLALAETTRITPFALRQARESVLTDASIERLRAAGELVSEYWDREDTSRPAPVRRLDIMIDDTTHVAYGDEEPEAGSARTGNHRPAD